MDTIPMAPLVKSVLEYRLRLFGLVSSVPACLLSIFNLITANLDSAMFFAIIAIAVSTAIDVAIISFSGIEKPNG